MQERRCISCNKKLCESDYAVVIKCPKCSTLNSFVSLVKFVIKRERINHH
ncbi:Com family DNA-binding transcriptional regulator [Mucilaginibacter xinganensis]